MQERSKGVQYVDLGETFPTSIYLLKSASIQPRTSPSKFGGNYSILFNHVLSSAALEVGVEVEERLRRPVRVDVRGELLAGRVLEEAHVLPRHELLAWAVNSNLELCLFPFPVIFPFPHTARFRAIFPFPRGKRFSLNAFSSNFQKIINAAFWENPEKFWSKFGQNLACFSKKSAHLWQNLQNLNFVKNQHQFQ